MSDHTILPSVNFHLIKPCNMGCKYCYAQFNNLDNQRLRRGGPSLPDALNIIDALADLGFAKITFAGGEPTLYPHLFEVIRRAKALGMTTMLVTNGSKLNETFFARYQTVLDWITVSIDSLSVDTNLRIGRVTHGQRVLSRAEYTATLLAARNYGYRIKVNTVVSRFNQHEDLNGFLKIVQPERWKVFQALPITGENDDYRPDYEISPAEYQRFLTRHDHQTALVPEDNAAMLGTYAMVDPGGCFYTNADGSHRRSEPILEVGAAQAYRQMRYDVKGFNERGGRYQW